jgi:hypothetical protein
MGYMGSAIAVFACFFVMMIFSYFLGQKYYPIPYNLKRIGAYFLVAVVIYVLSLFTSTQTPVFKFSIHLLFIAMYVLVILKWEKKELRGLFKFSKKK